MSYLRTTPLIALAALTPLMSQAGDRGAPTKVAYHFNITVLDPKTKQSSQVGTADYLSSTSATERITSFKVDAHDGTDTFSYVLEKTLDLHGIPILMKYSQIYNGQASKVSAKFVAGGVEVSTDALVDVKTIPLPKGAVLSDPSEEWFKTVTPKLGEQAETNEFDIRHTRWMKVTTKYVEDIQLKLGAKTYDTHRLHIVSDFGVEDFYVDGHGDPVLIDEEPQRVERADQ